MAILVSERLNFKVRTDLEITTEVFEHCIVKVKLRNEKLMCCSGYHAPNTDTSTFLLEYENILNNMKCDNNAKLVMGMDHNLDLLNYDKHRPTREFVSVNENHNLVPGITRPTRITHTSATLIDNIFVTDNLVPTLHSHIIIDDISDHLPMCVIFENVNVGTRDHKKITT